MNKDAILEAIRKDTFEIYQNVSHSLSFHGWHHIEFVHKQSLRFAAELGADPFLVAVAAYIHDLNYVVHVQSTTDAGQKIRSEMLLAHGFEEKVIAQIEKIIIDADILNRTADISPEAKALSDGDTLFKTLPITPVMFANAFLEEKSMPISKLADFIVKTQKPMFDQDIYFYSESARKYLGWAKTNFALWENVVEYLQDKELTLNTKSIQ